MSALVVLALALPLVAAVGVTVLREPWSGRLHVAAPAVAAAAWAVVVSSDATTVLGITVRPDVAAAAVGLAALAASVRPTSAVGRVAVLVSVTAVPTLAGLGDRSSIDDVGRATLVLAVLVLVAARSEGATAAVAVLGATGGVVAAAGAVLDDPVQGAFVVLAGLAVVAVAVAGHQSLPHRTGRTATRPGPPLACLLLPAVVLVAHRLLTSVPVADLDDVAPAGAALAVVAAAVALVGGATSPAPGSLLGLVVVLAGTAVSSQTLTAPAAGVLLAAGGVLAIAVDHPWGAVAALPGLTAVVPQFGAATEPVQAVAGGAALVALVVAGLRPVRTLPAGPVERTRLTVGVLAALALAVLPTWGWAGVALPDHAAAVAVAAAFGLPVLVLGAWWSERPLSTGGTTPAGRLAAHPSRPVTRVAFDSHGSPFQTVEREVPVEEVDVPVAGVEEDRTQAQPPVASSPGPVPRRAPGGGRRGGSRLRGRPGRAP